MATMYRAHLDELISVEQTYWWHVAKRELLLEVLKRECRPPAKILEGGIGGGNNLLVLKELGYEVSGLDIMPGAVQHCRTMGINAVQVHDLQQPWPVKSNSIDVVILLDVLEHCEDPSLVLRHAKATLRDEGKIIVTVPAIPFLMGPWDRTLGHHRRYTTSLLKKNTQSALLQLKWSSHWNSFSLPPALVMRTFERFCVSMHNSEFPRVPDIVNKICIELAKMERAAIRLTPLPIGLSLIGVITR